jgi:hypothetical protein
LERKISILDLLPFSIRWYRHPLALQYLWASQSSLSLLPWSSYFEHSSLVNTWSINFGPQLSSKRTRLPWTYLPNFSLAKSASSLHWSLQLCLYSHPASRTLHTGSQPCQISFTTIRLATTALSVVKAPLVEPRYSEYTYDHFGLLDTGPQPCEISFITSW